jgi:hypothetical protein
VTTTTTTTLPLFAIEVFLDRFADTVSNFDVTLTNLTTTTSVNLSIAPGQGQLNVTEPNFAHPGDSVMITCNYEHPSFPSNHYFGSFTLSEVNPPVIAFTGSGGWQIGAFSGSFPTACPFPSQAMTGNAAENLVLDYTFIMPAMNVHTQIALQVN